MLRPKDVADQLHISAPTLRLWSNNFSDVLSPAAQKSTTESGTAAQRRYTDEDLAVFRRAKQYLDGGKTYEETLHLLKESPPEPAEPPQSDETVPEVSSSLPAVNWDEHPVFVAFREALAAKDETIRAKDQALVATEATVRSKEETITALRSTIDLQERQLEDLRSRPVVTAPPAAAPLPASSSTRFRWGFLNRLLVLPGDNPAPVDGKG
jgi:DNA-binding transcriptional MerR regulator